MPKSTRTPVYRDTGFHLVDIPTMKRAFELELDYPRSPDNYIYSRYRNPNVVATEDMLMQIEESQWALLTQSGLAAIDVALSIFQEKGKDDKWLFFSEIYGGTNHFIDNVLDKRRGQTIVRFEPTNGGYSIKEFEKALKQHKPTLVFFEAISNPMLIALNAQDYIDLAKQHGAIVIVDNTFATPYLWKPLQSEADLVIHSVTKYLAGHGTISAGAVLGNCPQLEKMALEYRKLVGHMLSPDDAARLCEQLKTFNLRYEKHCSNASELATYLNQHPGVELVLFPGLKEHPSHGNAKNLFRGKGYGAIITFDLAGDTPEQKQQRCNRFIELVQDHIPLVPTLGDADTILMPIEPVWGDKYPFPGMIRLSVGIENPNDLKNIIGSALDGLK